MPRLHHRARRAAFACLAVLALSAGPALAQSQTLVVGTKEAPPFVIKDQDGRWSGISIALLDELAARLDLGYRLEERPVKGLIDGVADGSLDMALAALTITSAREERVDFSHPFYSTGLGIAVSTKGGGWGVAISRLVSVEFLSVVAGLTALLVAVGALAWLFERRGNAEQFGGGPLKGIGSGLWWAAVTMTTVGYGDKAPRTFAGRVVGLVWMFVAIIIISSFTAAMTTALTVGSLEGEVRGEQDLGRVRVGALAGSTGAEWLAARGLQGRAFDSVDDGMAAIESGRIDAFVNDAPILQYVARTRFAGAVEVLPETFERQDYGIALGRGSGLREPVNRALLAFIESGDWKRLLTRYLGD